MHENDEGDEQSLRPTVNAMGSSKLNTPDTSPPTAEVQGLNLGKKSSTADVMDLICSKKWREAKETIRSNPMLVYGRYGRNHRLIIHELCSLVTFQFTEETRGELSDDDDDDEVNDLGAVESRENLKNENEHLNEIVEEMIDISHDLGPKKIIAVPKDDEDDNINPNAQQQQEQPQQQRRETVDDVTAAIGGATIDENDHRYETYTSILRVTDTSGKTPLHVLCENSADSSMMQVLLSATKHPINDEAKGVKFSGHAGAPNALSCVVAGDSNGSTPLHYLAYSRICPFKSIRLLMDYANPVPVMPGLANSISALNRTAFAATCRYLLDPALCTDSDGDTPLHWALDGYMSPRRIHQLIRYDRKALWIRNSQGRRPIDLFVENFVDSDWYAHELCGREVWENIQGYIQVISGYNEDGILTKLTKEQQKDGNNYDHLSKEADCSEKKEDPANVKEKREPEMEWLPIHTIAGSTFDFPPIFLDIALHYNKDELSKANEHGYLPLHLACGRTSSTLQQFHRKQLPVIEAPCDGSTASKILSKYRKAAYTTATNHSKRLPIHIAVESRKPLHLIASLIKSYPYSLNIQDPVTSLWLFLLAGSSYKDSVDVSYSLLRADPSIMHLCLESVSRKGKS